MKKLSLEEKGADKPNPVVVMEILLRARAFAKQEAEKAAKAAAAVEVKQPAATAVRSEG